LKNHSTLQAQNAPMRDQMDDGAIILTVVIIVIIVGAVANACEQEVTYEN